ncbi:relaxation protein [Stenotrophomonas sp. S41]|uniref:relaxation protein n=1 Tax=Stenotrophomonas sp. S41 TaxID=2767464 RepID=UPI0019092E42|nr:relaxation protein [Stenotrophomonas sp. S41]MBK0011058.1 relaxation protein [Stenotrophomonas sp. S41]
MDERQLEDLISKTALLMERYQRLCTEMSEQQTQLSAALNGLTQSLPGQLRDGTDAAIAGLSGEGAAAVKQALLGPVSAYEQQLAASADHVGRSIDALSAEVKRLQLASRGVLWKSLAITVAAVAVLLGGAVWLGGRYQTEIERSQIEADLLRAYNRADVVLCGKEQLCANVETRGAGMGENGRYRVVRPRQ